MSQRHRVEQYGYASNGEPGASGVIGAPLRKKQEKEARDNRPDRDFPIGPFDILSVEPSQDPQGVYYYINATDGGRLETGDLVDVEATGDVDTNGEFTIDRTRSEPGRIGFFRPGVQHGSVITGKGRMRVLGNGMPEDR